MKNWTIDAVARGAADLFNRRSILALVGGAGVAAVTDAFVGEAKDEKGKKDKKQRKKRCIRYSRDCKAAATDYCFLNYDPPEREECQADIFVCCNYYKKCTRSAYRKGNTCNENVPW